MFNESYEKMRDEILNNFQIDVLKAISQSELARFFVWSGGTALAFGYLQHRLSIDLDFMSRDLFPDEYILAEIKKIAVHLRISQIREHKQFNRYEFWFKKNKSVLKVEFIFYPFKNMKKPKKIKNFNVLIDSIEDITANKTHAIYERYEPKDVFDLYWILIKKKIKFLKIFKWVEEKFGVKIDPVLFLSKLLRGADSLDKIRPLLLNKELLHTEAIKKYFQKEADKYLKKKI